jgi:uncharacterized protein with HEPN domain
MVKADLIDLTAFDPSQARAEAVSARMRGRLGESLRYILDQATGQMAVPWTEMAGFLARLARGPVSPLVFGIYCDLVLAIDANALDEAEQLLNEIAAAPNAPPELRILDLGDPLTDRSANRYRRLVDTDATLPFTISPPTPDGAAHIRGLIAQAFSLLDAGNQALAAEIRTLLNEIVLALGSDDPFAAQFDGVSSFLLWGATIFDVRSYKTPIEMVQALAHESGHNLLFGLCADGPLHENDNDERFASPLRRDPRPMDGIIHAAYVSARMHQSVQRLLDAQVLDETQHQQALAANVANAKHFAMGIDTVDRHSRLTPLGQSAMDNARRYMAAYL